MLSQSRGVDIVSQRAILAVRQGSQDCMKHAIKILRNCFSKESQHNSGSILVSSPESVECVESRVRRPAPPTPSNRLQRDAPKSVRVRKG